MKKSLVTLALAFALAATAQQATPPAGGQPGQTGQSGQVTIKDPAEYNAYVTALQQTDPSAKAQALEAFLQQYPNSVVKVSALELLMGTYQQSAAAAPPNSAAAQQNTQKTADAAQRLLQTDSNNLRALAVLTFLDRACSAQPGPNQINCLNDAGKYGQQGLQVAQGSQPPAGMSADDFAKLKTQVTPIFQGAVGMKALNDKQYPQAADALSQAVASNPNDIQNVYPLALAYLSQNPIDPKGLFWIAKAVALSNNNPQVAAFGKSKYVKYHGGDDGWQELVQQAASQQNIPPDFKVAPAPTPAEQAAKLADSKPVAQMSFDEFQMIFTSGNQAAADKVWSQIKGKPIAFEGKVVAAEKENIKLAATYDDIQANPPVADVDLTFPIAIPASLAPKVGAMAQVQGVPSTYDVNPFMIHMTDGKLVGKAAAATTTKKTTTKSKSTPKKKK